MYCYTDILKITKSTLLVSTSLLIFFLIPAEQSSLFLYVGNSLGIPFTSAVNIDLPGPCGQDPKNLSCIPNQCEYEPSIQFCYS